MNVRALRQTDLEWAAAVLYNTFARVAQARGYRPPWPDEERARELLEEELAHERDRVLVAEEGGALIGVAAMRVRGEVATVGPIASYVEGRGIGGALLDALLAAAEEMGAAAVRLYVDAWNPSAYALYAGRGFGVVDVVSHVERAPAKAPELMSSRGLEVKPVDPRDLDELVRFDTKLTGHARGDDLAANARLVARRRGSIVAYLAARSDGERVCLGPAVAVDASDLSTLLANALMIAERGARWIDDQSTLRARLSTSAPPASMAVLGLGFRVTELGVVMSRGAPPPARPTQLYSVVPELL